jgi:hypothetical protein
VKVYWLPWKDKLIASAKRSEFESDCDYFMTAKLEGCRFVLTKELVLHIASNVRNALPGSLGSITRTMAEAKLTKEARSRRLSISMADVAEGYYGIIRMVVRKKVVGMRSFLATRAAIYGRTKRYSG